MGWITPDARRNGVHAVCPLARQNIQLRTGCKNGVINDSFGVPFTTFVKNYFLDFFGRMKGWTAGAHGLRLEDEVQD